jgi:hypothetical protein
VLQAEFYPETKIQESIPEKSKPKSIPPSPGLKNFKTMTELQAEILEDSRTSSDGKQRHYLENLLRVSQDACFNTIEDQYRNFKARRAA